MKRATLILFWAHLLTFSRGTWAQAPQQRTPQAPEQRTPEQRTPEQRTPEQRTPEQQAPHEEELPWYLLWGVEGSRNDNPRGTTSLGMPLNAPLSPTAQHVSWGLGVSAGAGYNFNRRHALVGDFMWNWLYPAEQGIRPSGRDFIYTLFPSVQFYSHQKETVDLPPLALCTGRYRSSVRPSANDSVHTNHFQLCVQMSSSGHTVQQLSQPPARFVQLGS